MPDKARPNIAIATTSFAAAWPADLTLLVRGAELIISVIRSVVVATLIELVRLLWRVQIAQQLRHWRSPAVHHHHP